MRRDEIIRWLREDDEASLEELWRLADKRRRACVGNEVHLRGLIEISNYCARLCHYCGLRADNARIERYRMTEDEIVECARQAESFGYGTVVLQSGEDFSLSTDWIARLVARIKKETPLAVTLSFGERCDADLAAWRDAGADRYLLRFETSNRELFDTIHPPRGDERSDRLAILQQLRELGYETGSGVMIGIPGQTYDDLANDVETFARLDLDMIGVGPFIAHPDTPLGSCADVRESEALRDDQVPATELMTYKVMALARLVCPLANIPSTSALATLNIEEGRELGLVRGANVLMPNVTPPVYRCKYEIYPAKACIYETAVACHGCIKRRITSLGRSVGVGRGDSPRRIRSEGPAARAG